MRATPSFFAVMHEIFWGENGESEYRAPCFTNEMLNQERFALELLSAFSNLSAPPQTRDYHTVTNAMRDVVIDFIVRQMMRRSPEDQNDPYMVGDLPLKRQKYLCEVLRREDGNQRVVNVDSDGESIFSYLENRNCFGQKHLAIIAKFVATHKMITILNREGNKFDDSSVILLNNAVEKNKTLVELSLLHTGISLATKTQRSLVLNNNLMHIDLSCNDLGANGAKSIIKHLKKNPPFQCSAW